jgi:hypothetical protein
MITVWRQGRFGRLRAHAGKVSLVAAIALQLACYRYVPTELAAVQVGGHVRAVVDATAAERLRTSYGIAGTTLDGRVVGRQGDVLTLSVPSVPLGSPFGADHPLYQQVPVAPADVVGVDVRSLDVFRTGALLGVGAAAVTVIAVRALGGGTGGTTNGSGGGPSESVRPWTVHVRIPLP